MIMFHISFWGIVSILLGLYTLNVHAEEFSSPFSNPQLRWSVLPSLGVTSIAYQQSGVPDVAENTLTFRLGVTRPLSSVFNFNFSGFYNAVILNSKAAPLSIQFLGLNGRIGVNTGILKRPWNLALFFGLLLHHKFQ